MGKKNRKEPRVVVFTGASSGIGRATASLLGKEGFALVLAARRKRELTSVAASIDAPSVLVHETDVQKADDVKGLFAAALTRFGRIDVLINCAGVLAAGPIEGATEAQIRAVLDTNLLGTILCCKYAVSVMKAKKQGQIINISSVAGTRGQPNMAVYSASKFGVMGFTESLALELKGTGIKVTSIRPGTVVTDLWKESWTKETKSKADGVYLKPEEVAEAILFAMKQSDRAVVRDLFIHPLA